MLAAITKKTIHEEAKHPSFNAVEHILQRRWNYLGHILRLDENRTLRKYLIELSPKEKPYVEGSLFDDTSYRTVDEIVIAAQNRSKWRAEGGRKGRRRKK